MKVVIEQDAEARGRYGFRMYDAALYSAAMDTLEMKHRKPVIEIPDEDWRKYDAHRDEDARWNDYARALDETTRAQEEALR